jgi:uncharacterized protein (TIGR02172 family)
LIARGRTAEVFELGADRVLKLMLPDFSAELGAMEERAGAVVGSAGLAAPRLLETFWVEDRFGLVYERVIGPSMLQALQSKPLHTGRLAAELARLHVEMHAASARNKGLPNLKDSLRRMIGGSEWVPDDLRGTAMERLDRLPDRDAILHYDLHPGNVLMTDSGSRVIDWMTVQSGDPAADIARTIFLVRDTGVAPVTSTVERAALFAIRRWFLRSYVRAYGGLAGYDVAAVRAWRPVVLAGRLAEGIVDEHPRLIAELRRTL